MKRYDMESLDDREVHAIDVFLQEIQDVCQRHGFSISEDSGGWFVIERYNKNLMACLNEAYIGTTLKERKVDG